MLRLQGKTRPEKSGKVIKKIMKRTELRFVATVTTGGRVKFVPGV